MNDPIVDEVRRAREAQGARFQYDLDAIFRDIKEQEKKAGRKFVSFAPRRIESNVHLLGIDHEISGVHSCPRLHKQ